MAKTQSVLDRVLSDQASLQEAAEARLLALAESGAEPTYSDYQLFASVGWDSGEFVNQLRRMNRVLAALAWRPSEARLAELKTATDAAATLAKSKGDELRAQIEALTTELKALEQDADSKARTLGATLAAREKLRDPSLLPPWKADEFHSRRRAVADEWRQPLHETETDIKQAELAAGLHWHNRDDHDQIRNILRANKISAMGGEAEKWASLQAKMAAKLPELRTRRDELKTRLDEGMVGVDGALDHYVAQLDG